MMTSELEKIDKAMCSLVLKKLIQNRMKMMLICKGATKIF